MSCTLCIFLVNTGSLQSAYIFSVKHYMTLSKLQRHVFMMFAVFAALFFLLPYCMLHDFTV